MRTHKPTPNPSLKKATSASGAAGFVSWIHSSLAVEDVLPATQFLEAAFGFRTVFVENDMAAQIEAMTGAAGMRCDLVQMRHPASGHVLELIAFHPLAGALLADSLPVRPGASHVAFTVNDLQAAKAAVETLGAVTLGDVTQFEDGLAIYCRVPGGAFIELEQASSR